MVSDMYDSFTSLLNKYNGLDKEYDQAVKEREIDHAKLLDAYLTLLKRHP